MEEVKEEKKTNVKKNTNKSQGNNKKSPKNDSFNKNNSNNKANNGKKNVKNNSTVKKSFLDKSDEEIEILDKTNSLDIVIDEIRLKDKESLDFSFIDGKRKKKKAKDDIELLDEVNYKEEVKKIDVPVSKGSEAFSTALIIIFSFVLGFLVSFIIGKESGYFTETDIVVEKVVEEKVVVDDNYVFVGDSIFKGYDLEKYYEDMPVINSGISGHKTTDILNNINDRIYRYNPSKVILLIGTNDYSSISNEDTVKNIGKIIDGIKNNRPYAEIYVQSIYPVNKEVGNSSAGGRNNEDINTMNKGIKKLCEDKEVNYMNIHDLLVDEDGNLNSEYTYDGLHITDAGYKIITEEVMKILKK